ncbi:hypothetical protein SLEP1_g17981 [Rubroshorea leprosula]|uniref:Uncharacterized protein n=1 Tax=Rubroshorea leprosula TaxID=152421 RepID=A0AAV5IW20_9ROSI|nr:hypothetical protein SLEP1_g17981 [Rubroshorea leprosula]
MAETTTDIHKSNGPILILSLTPSCTGLHFQHYMAN